MKENHTARAWGILCHVSRVQPANLMPCASARLRGQWREPYAEPRGRFAHMHTRRCHDAWPELAVWEMIGAFYTFSCGRGCTAQEGLPWQRFGRN
eukprot:scaffold47917_cov32-Tisochrysis_lutea.AAC.2